MNKSKWVHRSSLQSCFSKETDIKCGRITKFGGQVVNSREFTHEHGGGGYHKFKIFGEEILIESICGFSNLRLTTLWIFHSKLNTVPNHWNNEKWFLWKTKFPHKSSSLLCYLLPIWNAWTWFSSSVLHSTCTWLECMVQFLAVLLWSPELEHPCHLLLRLASPLFQFQLNSISQGFWS